MIVPSINEQLAIDPEPHAIIRARIEGIGGIKFWKYLAFPTNRKSIFANTFICPAASPVEVYGLISFGKHRFGEIFVVEVCTGKSYAIC